MAAFFCRLLEDYADEGLWRPALYYRWAFAKDACSTRAGSRRTSCPTRSRRRRCCDYTVLDRQRRVPTCAARASRTPIARTSSDITPTNSQTSRPCSAPAVPVRRPAEPGGFRLLRLDVPAFRHRPDAGAHHARHGACCVRVGREDVECAVDEDWAAPVGPAAPTACRRDSKRCSRVLRAVTCPNCTRMLAPCRVAASHYSKSRSTARCIRS